MTQLNKHILFFLQHMRMVGSDCCLRKSSRIDVVCPRFKLALLSTHCVTLAVSFWMWLLTIIVSVTHTVKNNHWLTLTKILQHSNSAFVKLDLMIWKEPSSTFIWWLNVLFPQIVSPLRAESSQRETQYNRKSTGFDDGCICLWISAPPSTGCFTLNKTLNIENN